MAALTPDPVNFTDSTQWIKLIETAYDKAVEFKRWEQPLFRQFFNKKLVSPSMDSNSYVFTLHNNFAAPSTTPLAELTTPAALAPVAPDRVTVTVNEYGDYAVETLRLDMYAFTQPKQELVALLARQQGDKVDALAKAVIDSSTNIQRAAGRTATNLITTSDVFNAAEARRTRTRMERTLNRPLSGDQYTVVAHPDQLFDLKSEAGANTWSAPHVYQDTSNIYTGEVGSYMGLKFVSSTRVTSSNVGAASIPVYTAYCFADQAVAEVCLMEPRTILGPVVDPLKRFYTVGWLMNWGASLYRPEALLKIQTATSFA